MGHKLRGKCLIRQVTLSGGDQALMVTGVFHPTNFDVSEIDSNDEMWVADVEFDHGGLRYASSEILSISPEDFLSGEGQLPTNWKTKSKL